MKLVCFSIYSTERLGIYSKNRIIDVETAYRAAHDNIGGRIHALPSNVIDFLKLGEVGIEEAQKVEKWFSAITYEPLAHHTSFPIDAINLMAPIPHPTSMRDGYAFRQHVESARRNRGLEMIPEFDEIPIFYFTNHQAVFGEGDIHVQAEHCKQLDFELECAIVIGKQGRNISTSEADKHIAGYMVMNDWSARAMQMQEMKLNLGPAKGKDFATSIGPWLVTKEELADRKIATDHGDKYDLEMTCRINGESVSQGNVKDMSWTFAQIIERASYGVTLYPGDVIGSGTCGTGCFLELNGSKVYDPARWVEPGDVVECEIELLGTLTNRVVLVE